MVACVNSRAQSFGSAAVCSRVFRGVGFGVGRAVAADDADDAVELCGALLL
jgi:hypothetical protein